MTDAIPEAKEGQGLLIAGVVSALLIPVIGFLLAIILLAKNQVGPGLAVLLCCVVGVFINIAVFLA